MERTHDMLQCNLRYTEYMTHTLIYAGAPKVNRSGRQNEFQRSSEFEIVDKDVLFTYSKMSYTVVHKVKWEKNQTDQPLSVPLEDVIG